MMVSDLVALAVRRHDCVVAPPSGVPEVGFALPQDLVEFWTLCGGMTFEDWIFPMTVVGPARFIAADLIVLGELADDPRTRAWYAIAEASESGGAERAVIDLAPDQLGHCYNAFWDRYANPGYMEVVARSFTELLRRLLLWEPDEEDAGPYWMDDDFEAPGDAYD